MYPLFGPGASNLPRFQYTLKSSSQEGAEALPHRQRCPPAHGPATGAGRGFQPRPVGLPRRWPTAPGQRCAVRRRNRYKSRATAGHGSAATGPLWCRHWPRPDVGAGAGPAPPLRAPPGWRSHKSRSSPSAAAPVRHRCKVWRLIPHPLATAARGSPRAACLRARGNSRRSVCGGVEGPYPTFPRQGNKATMGIHLNAKTASLAKDRR